jgi:tetratricopeptide (TPR) repeat protein
VADALAAIGNAESELGDLDAALASHRAARAIYEEVFGAEHEQIGNSLEYIGDVLLRRGDARQALQHHQKALAMREKAHGPDFLDNAFALSGIGEAHLMLGDPEAAIPPLERARAVLEQQRVLPSLLAKVQFQLARALWNDDRRRDEAMQLAARAGEGFRSLATPVGDADAARVAAWAAKRE